jgi:integrase/recombinase XerD
MLSRHQRLVDEFRADLELRAYRPNTILSYEAPLIKYLQYTERVGGSFGQAHAKAYLLHLLRDEEAGPSKHKMHASALKCFYALTLAMPHVARAIPVPKVPRSLPDVLSTDDVKELVRTITPLKQRMAATLTYAGGLRIDEACSVMVDDIDSKRMVIHIRRAKGGKDRYVMLSERLLLGLRAYYAEQRPGRGYLFPGRAVGNHISAEAVRKSLRKAVVECKLSKRVTPHILRHCFATHLLEQGTELRIIQALMGHASIRTTTRYAHVSRDLIGKATSPYDVMTREDEERDK